MSVTRLQALRGLQCSLRQTGLRASRTAASTRTHLAAGRRFASSRGDHGPDHGEPTSDIPWMVGSVAVTIAGIWFLWPSEARVDHGHRDTHVAHRDSHDKGKDSNKDDAPEEAEEPPKEEDDSQDDSKDDDDENSGESDPSEAAQSKEQPESKGNTEGVAFKGKTSQGKEDTRKTEDDSKGAKKKRIDSHLGRNLGEGPEFVEEEGKPKTEATSTAKPAQKGKYGEITGKQFGLSNTPTRHSIPDDRKQEISHKAEGTPESAKAMGTVDVNRPQK